jgi:hypothetical protein
LTGGILVLDDSTLEKPFSRFNALVYQHWSGKQRTVVSGINLITLLSHRWYALSCRSITECLTKIVTAKQRTTISRTCYWQPSSASLDDVSGEWTGKDVPLFYLTLKFDGKYIDAFTCNQIQGWIIREFWLRGFPEAEIEIRNL